MGQISPERARRGPAVFEEWEQWPLGERQRRRLLSVLASEPSVRVLALDEDGTAIFAVPACFNRSGEVVLGCAGKVSERGQLTWR